MFEGLVRQLILGYLGQYIKDIQKEQLKITLWNEEVLLENVELILEAFDYLQLPFALRKGTVGKLSIRIPWKKLGWDPIIIILEDVAIFACRREDKEWRADAIEKREFAGKKAKLAAAELAKLSRRVCDNQTGKSFISYITAKILDGIQVSVRNVHVQYRDVSKDSAVTLFGVKFSSLLITRQNLTGFSSVKLKGGQVNKLIEVQGLEIYCSSFQGDLDLLAVDDVYAYSHGSKRHEDNKHRYMLSPLDMSVFISVNRSGKLENDAPQYSVNFELTRLVISVDEVQLQQILTIYDYITICQLREKYGRYRPWQSPLEKKLKGWQIAWWQYAQKSVLLDVQKRLRKTSWKYLGDRMNCRKKYVNLYKTKLKCLQQDQVIDEDVLWELEEMEKEADIDDILTYRSAAEHDLQDFFVKAVNDGGSNSANSDKSLEDDRSSVKPRGWLNWLSRGMLGASGTIDSGHFSGVISDDVIQDIFEATKFHPTMSLNGDVAANVKIYLSSVKLNICEFSATLLSMKLGCAIADLVLENISLDCKIWDDSAVILASVNSARLLNPLDMQAILVTKRDELKNEQPSLALQVDVLSPNSDVSFSVKVDVQPVEVLCHLQFIKYLSEFLCILEDLSFQHDRILSSLNGITDIKARLLSKTEYVVSYRKRMIWDVTFFNIILTIPWENPNSKVHKMVIEAGKICFLSGGIDYLHSDMQNHYYPWSEATSSKTSDALPMFQHQDLYDHFEIDISNFEVKMLVPQCDGTLSLVEKSSASLVLATCIISNEPALKGLDVNIKVSPLLFHFSPLIYEVIMGLATHINMVYGTTDPAALSNQSGNIDSNGQITRNGFWFSLTANLESVSFEVDLESDTDSCTLMMSLQMLDIWLEKKDFLECWASTKAMRILAYHGKSGNEYLILSSSEYLPTCESGRQHQMSIGPGNHSGNSSTINSSSDGCFHLHFQSYTNLGFVCPKYVVTLNNLDIHCYPFIVGQLICFTNSILSFHTNLVESQDVSGEISLMVPVIKAQKFGVSKLSQNSLSNDETIPQDNFPFATIHNRSAIYSLEGSLIRPIPEWRKESGLVDWENRSPISSMIQKEFNSFHGRPMISASLADFLPHVSNDSSIVTVDLHISSINVHFHESADVLGTISLPEANSVFFINDELFDISISTLGVTLSSSWWTSSIHEYLWGPISPDVAPILNLRVKKEVAALEKSFLHFYFGIQCVSCTLPPDFLAVVIGYFSLPDWNFGGKELPFSGISENTSSENKIVMDYNIEILGSNLFTPLHGDGSQFLKLEIEQLYCSFLEEGGIDVTVKEIPSDCSVMPDKIADRNDCVNLFGRELCLSLLLQEDELSKSTGVSEVSGIQQSTLISPFSADVWVRIPSCEASSVATSYPTCIMATVTSCQVNADDAWALAGYVGLLDIINQFSLITEKSKFYTGDISQFRQLKKSLVQNPACPPEVSPVAAIEIRFCVRSMSVRLHLPVKESTTSEMFAHAEMQFSVFVSLVHDIPQVLNLSFSSLALFSSLNSVKLAECTNLCSGSPVLEVTLVELVKGAKKFDIILPSLEIWFYMFDWSQVINAVESYSGELCKLSAANQLENTSYSEDLAQDSSIDIPQDCHQSLSMPCSNTPGITEQDTDSFLLNMDKVDITIHVPVQLSANAFSIFSEYAVPRKTDENSLGMKTPSNQYGFVSFTIQCRCAELNIDGETIKLKINFEKAKGTVELYSGSNQVMRPLFQLSQINLEAQIVNYQMAHMCIKIKIQCDTLDGWISSHIIHMWCLMQFEVPEGSPSHLAFGSLELQVKLRKLALLLTDGKWSPSGPLLEVVMRNFFCSSKLTDEDLEGCVESDLQVNYNNIDKVMWEPFIEPWQLQLKIAQRHDKSALLNNARMTDIHVQSESQLNINVTESLIEVASRTIAMIKGACGLIGMPIPSEGREFPSYQMTKYQHTGRYAPYIIQNLTSLPLVFSVCKGQLHSVDLDLNLLSSQDIYILDPGSSLPIYVDETPEEQLVRRRPSQSSERLSDKHLLEAAHHYILIQLEGTSTPSGPISIDLVGLRYIEVDFSNSSNKSEVHHVKNYVRSDNKVGGHGSLNTNGGFVVPVVVDVSVERYTKLIRLYSTVVLLNATPVPLEVRFDIPFGLSPKILDPIYPGQEFPLPLHLAEAGRVRWRPLGNTYLWSEAYSISSILSNENKISYLRSMVCYPSHPSSDPFRCCLLVNSNCLPSAGKLKKGFPIVNSHQRIDINGNCDQSLHDLDTSKQRFIHWVTLSSPLVLKNYLPEVLSMIVENGSVTRNASLSEVETSFFHVDSSHDLTITFRMCGYKPSGLKFPRAETFGSMAKFDGVKYSLPETITFYPESSGGPLYVTIEKIMDAISGAREVCISVPFLLYNCTGFPLVVSASLNEMNGYCFTLPSCYDLDEQELFLCRKNGLAVLSSDQDLHSPVGTENPVKTSSKIHIMKRSDENSLLRKPSSAYSSSSMLRQNLEATASSQLDLQSDSFAKIEKGRVDACMYSPEADCSPGDVKVRVSRCLPAGVAGDVGNGPWSQPFLLIPPTGSINVLVPQPSSCAGHVISVSSVASPYLGKTKLITFQPRYVISNACRKSFCYKQKGTDVVLHLEAEQHSVIQWADTTRDLLVSVRFDEPGWQWSGCFLPDHLGDTQVKMRNFISGEVIMIRIEVQSADMSLKEEKVVGSPTGSSGTHLILVSVDDTGFMPYRIDNFSKERLRVYQQRCESFETLVNSYTSCPYAWDEPCNPHRLTVEIPGERVVGSYAIDDVKDFSPVYFPATSEKPERTLLVSVHSEGAIKVLSIIDSTYHILNDLKNQNSPGLKDKKTHAPKLETHDHYTERIVITVPFIGISLMNSSPEELLFACAKGVAVEFLQSLEQQKFCLQISSLQIDNQLHNTPYPVILSFESENKSQPVSQTKMIDEPLKISAIASDKLHEPVLYLAIAKWRNKDIAVVSFEYVSLRVADFHLELEQDIILSTVDFMRTTSTRLQTRVLDYTESTLHPLFPDIETRTSAITQTNSVANLRNRQYLTESAMSGNQKRNILHGSVVPIGAPWQEIHLLARQQKKIYVEHLYLAPVKFSLSFSSSPWMLGHGVLTSGESLIHRGLMALADIEGAQIHLKQLTLSHQLASWESIQEILVRHYTRQFLHEMYKLFGSAGVLGNPIGFARSVGLGIKDFLSVPVRSVFKSPAGLLTGMAQGTTSLLSNTVYAVSDAATQFSKVAHKGIVAFTFDDQIAAKMDKPQKATTSQRGLINGFFEGLTGLLQSPIRGAEKHGIPGVLSGVALGVTGLVARPAASILEVTGKTAQSIRNRSRSHHMGSGHLRVRLPRALSSESALRPYSWEEAIGSSILAEADEGMKLRDEILVMCKTLKQGGRFVVITDRLVLVVSCSSLVDLGKPNFRGIPAEPEWVIETDIQLDSIIHADCNEEVVHIVGSSSDTFIRQNQNQQRRASGNRGKQWNHSHSVLPLFHTNLEFVHKNEAEDVLRVLLSMIEKGKEHGWGSAHLLHQSNLR